MSQNLRVALWVPQADPANIGYGIRTNNFPTAHDNIPTEFAAAGGGGGGGAEFADAAETAAGIVADEVISPATLRTEMIREFNIPGPAFAGAIAIATSAGVASANLLVKTNAAGVIDATLVQGLEMDGGVF